MMLYFKDHFNVPGDAYHEIAQLCQAMRQHYKLKDRIQELNKLWNSRPTPESCCGVQQSLKERCSFVWNTWYALCSSLYTLYYFAAIIGIIICMRAVICTFTLTLQIVRLPDDANFITSKKVRVKVTGDGTNIGKHLQFEFMILDA